MFPNNGQDGWTPGFGFPTCGPSGGSLGNMGGFPPPMGMPPMPPSMPSMPPMPPSMPAMPPMPPNMPAMPSFDSGAAISSPGGSFLSSAVGGGLPNQSQQQYQQPQQQHPIPQQQQQQSQPPPPLPLIPPRGYAGGMNRPAPAAVPPRTPSLPAPQTLPASHHPHTQTERPAFSSQSSGPQESQTNDRGEAQSEKKGSSFQDTLEEAKRRAEESRRKMEQEEEDKLGSVEEQQELRNRLELHRGLDSKAMGALSQLGVRDALKALRELDAKGDTIRNPSAWVCKTATNLRERRDRSKESGQQQQQQQQQETGKSGKDEEGLGIVDHYKDLEVEETADESVIKKSYRKLVLKWHPDKHPDGREEAEVKIRAINTAYEVLSNSAKRAAYDAQRQAVIRQKRGQGPDVANKGAPRQRIPREFMLQPIGFPDKFLRYSDERARAHCVVNSRGDAKLDGMSGLEQFVPFFKAAKLSLWWLPDVNNMCRIRALEARTRSSAGERVVAGRPGGYNLGFYINGDGFQQEAEVVLMEAGKGEKKENVNFIVIPSPLYENAFRFEAAFRKGYFLAFRPPTYLRMIAYNGGKLPDKTVIDFTLVDFQAMFKFIDVEEVLRPVLERHQRWMKVEEVKADPDVAAYFQNILQKPMWDDEDFQTYFEGHFETWEYRQSSDGSGPEVRLRGVDERLGYALDHIKDSDEAASLIVGVGDEIRQLRLRYMARTIEALSKPGSEDVPDVLRRMQAQRAVLNAFFRAFAIASEDSTVTELAKVAKAMQELASREGTSPDVIGKTNEACENIGKLVARRLSDAERTGSSSSSLYNVPVQFLKPLLALPGVGQSAKVLSKLATPPLQDAPIKQLTDLVTSAKRGNAGDLAEEIAKLVLKRMQKDDLLGPELARVLKELISAGVALEACAEMLVKSSRELSSGEMSGCLVALAEKSHESSHMTKACEMFAKEELDDISSAELLALATASAKSSDLSICVDKVVGLATILLASWPAADAVRLLLAVAKIKGSAVEKHTRLDLLRTGTLTLPGKLGDLPAAELVRLALAVQPAAGEQGEAPTAETVQLMEAVGKEVVKRLSDLPPPHLMLLTQGLAPLGGKNSVLRDICGFWSEALRPDRSLSDEVSRRRMEVEKGQSLKADQVVKLLTSVTPILKDLDRDTSRSFLSSLGSKLVSLVSNLGDAQKKLLKDQVQAGEGVGLWDDHSKLLRAFDGRRSSRSRSRRRRGRSSSSRDRGRRRRSPSMKRRQSSSRQDRRKKRAASSSSSSSRGGGGGGGRKR